MPHAVAGSVASGWQAFTPEAAVQHPVQPVVVLHAHTPPLHVVPTPHLIPHPPQLLLSVAVLVHPVTGHTTSPAMHVHATPRAVTQASPGTVEQSVVLANAPFTHVCTASVAAEHCVSPGAHCPAQPVPGAHVLWSGVQA